MSTTAGWAEVMYNGIDSVGINMQPKHHSSPIFAIYFVMIIITGYFFVLNFFIGVVISSYNREKEKAGKDYKLSPQ